MAAVDFAISQLANSPGVAGTSFEVIDEFFNGTEGMIGVLCPSGQRPTPVNSEKVLITAVSGDTITVEREFNGTGPVNAVAGYDFYAAVTVEAVEGFKTIADLQAAIDALPDVDEGPIRHLKLAPGLDLVDTAGNGIVNDKLLCEVDLQGSRITAKPGDFSYTLLTVDRGAGRNFLNTSGDYIKGNHAKGVTQIAYDPYNPAQIPAGTLFTINDGVDRKEVLKVYESTVDKILNGAVNNSSDPVTVNVDADSDELLPTANFYIKIDNEILLCTSRTGNALTCTRAQDGTSIASHLDDAPVTCYVIRLYKPTVWDYTGGVARIEIFNDPVRKSGFINANLSCDGNTGADMRGIYVQHADGPILRNVYCEGFAYEGVYSELTYDVDYDNHVAVRCTQEHNAGYSLRYDRNTGGRMKDLYGENSYGANWQAKFLSHMQLEGRIGGNRAINRSTRFSGCRNVHGGKIIGLNSATGLACYGDCEDLDFDSVHTEGNHGWGVWLTGDSDGYAKDVHIKHLIARNNARGGGTEKDVDIQADSTGCIIQRLNADATINNLSDALYWPRLKTMPFIPADAFWPTGGSPDIAERGTGKEIRAWALSHLADEDIRTLLSIPEDWDEGAMFAEIWCAPSGTDDGNVAFKVLGRDFDVGELADDNTQDWNVDVLVAMGAVAGYVRKSSLVSFTPSPDQNVIALGIYRFCDGNALDTLEQDVWVYGVQPYYVGRGV